MSPEDVGLEAVDRLRAREALGSITVIRLVAEPLGYLRVGAGESPLEPGELRVVRVRDRVNNRDAYLIPSTSIKGVLRRLSEQASSAVADQLSPASRLALESHHEVEGEGLAHWLPGPTQLALAIARVLTSDEELGREVLTRTSTPPDEVDEVLEKLRSMDKTSPPDLVKRLEPLLASTCPVCSIWGGKSLRGKALVHDALIPRVKEVKYRTRVSIHTPSATREERALYAPEYIIPAQPITITITVENLEPGSDEAKIMALTLEAATKLGLRIGGHKTAGAGALRISAEESTACIAELPKARTTEEKLRALMSPCEGGRRLALDEYISLLRQGRG